MIISWQKNLCNMFIEHALQVALFLMIVLLQIGESFSISEESSSKPRATNLTLIFSFPLTNVSVGTYLVVIVF